MKPPNILCTDSFTPESLAYLQQNLSCKWTEDYEKAEGLLIRSHTLINENFLEPCKNLKVIVSATSGFDHIDLQATQKRNISTFYTPSANVDSVAEHTLFFILGLMKNWKHSQTLIRQYKWKKEAQKSRTLNELHIGLIGFGRIGKKVAQLLKSFNCHILVYDPYETQIPSDIQRVGLTELLCQSDILSLHVPLTSETRHLINTQTLSLMPSHGYIINTSRGAVINEQDLEKALERQQIAGAALDVFEKEPLNQNSKLRSLGNVLLTPHIAANTQQAYMDSSSLAVKKMVDFFSDQNPSEALPPSTPWAQYLLKK